jgi:hypothetical protein
MLYHLIVLNPNKDITLHVSANSPAMVRCIDHLSLGTGLLNPFSCFTTALDLKRKNLWWDFMKITSIQNHEHPKMHSDCDYDDDLVL